MIELKDIIDLYNDAVDKVEFYWNFYSIVIISIIGWLLSNRHTMPRHFKTMLTAGFLFFAGMNFYSLMSAYTMFEAVQADLRAQLEMISDQGLKATHSVFDNMGFRYQKLTAFLVHLIIGSMVMVMVWHPSFRRTDMDKEQ